MDMDLTIGGMLLLGLVLGVQHALEPDHVAAVTSLATGGRSRRSILRHGVAWGIGHALTLSLIAGSAVVFGFAIGDGVADWLEFTVGVMLVLLGGHVLYRLRRDRVHFHVHSHDDGTVHLHAHSHAGETARKNVPHREVDHDHAHPETVPWRSLAVGLMHGVAGSAALVVLTVATASSPWTGLLYVVVFGVGSVVGMAALSAAIAVPLGWTGRRLTRFNSLLRAGVGFGTAGLGFLVMYQTQVAGWLS